jgi:hypothetical protein
MYDLVAFGDAIELTSKHQVNFDNHFNLGRGYIL